MSYINNRTFKDIRQYKNMSQREFAEHLDVSLATIALIETDRLNVTDRIQSKLAHIFDVTDDDFLVYIKRKRDIERLLTQNKTDSKQ